MGAPVGGKRACHYKTTISLSIHRPDGGPLFAMAHIIYASYVQESYESWRLELVMATIIVGGRQGRR